MHLAAKEKHWLRVKGWEKFCQVNGPWKKAGIAILIFNKVDFKQKLVRRENEGQYILLITWYPSRENNSF
jgi:hypothetical protein